MYVFWNRAAERRQRPSALPRAAALPRSVILRLPALSRAPRTENNPQLISLISFRFKDASFLSFGKFEASRRSAGLSCIVSSPIPFRTGDVCMVYAAGIENGLGGTGRERFCQAPKCLELAWRQQPPNGPVNSSLLPINQFQDFSRRSHGRYRVRFPWVRQMYMAFVARFKTALKTLCMAAALVVSTKFPQASRRPG